MNSRERVLSAINHKEPDKVPIDFGGHRSSGIFAIAYARLKKALGISAGNIYVYDMVQQLAIVEPEVLDNFGVDVIEMGRGFMLDDREWKDWNLPDGTVCKIPYYVNIEKRGADSYLVSDEGIDLAIQKEGFVLFEQIHWPWAERDIREQDFSDIGEAFNDAVWTRIPTPGGHIPLTADGLTKISSGVRELRETTDRAIVGLFGGNLFEVPQYLYGMEKYLTFMASYPDDCIRLSEALCELYIRNLEKWLGAVGPYIDVILFGDDYGGQNGPLISPHMYRTYYKSYHKKMWKRVKELAPHVKINLHSCGGIEPLLDDLIDAGLEMTNPVQISCKGMDARHLKKTYGDRFTFWGGGCDTHRILPYGTCDEVKRHVKEQVSILAPGGGFVFQQVHNIMANVPAENIIAMFEAVRE